MSYEDELQEDLRQVREFRLEQRTWTVRRIVERVKRGDSTRAIAEELQVGRRTVFRVMALYRAAASHEVGVQWAALDGRCWRGIRRKGLKDFEEALLKRAG